MDYDGGRGCLYAVMPMPPVRPDRLRPLFIPLLSALMLLLLAPGGVAASARPALAEDVTVFDGVALRHDQAMTEPIEENGVRYLNLHRTAEKTLTLPAAPANLRDARRIVAIVDIKPVLMQAPDKRVRPADPWTRLGYLTVVLPGEGEAPAREVEIMRFITGFGGAQTFRHDVTALAPLLHGETTLRIMVDTWLDPGWEVTVRLSYDDKGVGYRRPAFAQPVFHSRWVTSDNAKLRATVTIPEGLNQPRLRVISTGHADDGRDAHEFLSATHVLRIDGQIVAMWRPWREDGGTRRDQNPSSGRWEIDGRVLFSSDIDRSGWVPGVVVAPLIIPLPELAPGTHEIELEVLDIRPPDPETSGRGYWVESAIVVADEPWPSGPGAEEDGDDDQ